MRTGSTRRRARALRGQEPGRARRARRRSPPPASAACRCIGELELAWRLLAEPLLRRHRHQRQDDGRRAARPRLAHGGRAGRGRRQRRHARSPRWSARSTPEATIVCEASSFQLEDTDAFAPECGVLLNLAPDHLDRHGDARRLPGGEAAACSRTRATTTSASTTAPTRQLAGLDLGGCGRRVAFCTEPATDDCGAVIAGGVLELWGEPLLELSELALIGPHNAANAAAAAAAAAAAMGIEREAIADGAAQLRRRPAPARAGRRDRRRRSTSTTRRRPTSPRPRAALRSFDGGVRAILGGSLKGGGFAELAAPVAERCRRRLPDRRGRASRSSATSSPPGRPGSSTAAATASPRPSRRGRRRPRRRARSSCWRPPAPASTPTATSRSAASTSATLRRRSSR